MKFHYANLETCHAATELAVVIDVIRAFTNTAYAFSRGAREIYTVGTVEEALRFKAEQPDILAFGEIGGIPPDGFDFGNSPTQTDTLDLTGRKIVQRTSAGTQGIVRSTNAQQIIAASFVVASATIRYIHHLQPEIVTFVITGQTYDGGEEDLACAEYLEAALCGGSPDPAPFLERVKTSHDAQVFYDPDMPQFPETDILHCTSLDRFDFAMPIARQNGYLVMRSLKT